MPTSFCIHRRFSIPRAPGQCCGQSQIKESSSCVMDRLQRDCGHVILPALVRRGRRKAESLRFVSDSSCRCKGVEPPNSTTAIDSRSTDSSPHFSRACVPNFRHTYQSHHFLTTYSQILANRLGSHRKVGALKCLHSVSQLSPTQCMIFCPMEWHRLITLRSHNVQCEAVQNHSNTAA